MRKGEAMADICIFCGKETTIWNGGDVLVCGGVTQPVCGACRDRYIGLPLRQRARLALETGRARTPESIQEYLDKLDAALAQEATRREYQEKSLACCGQEMAQVDEVSFLSRTDLFQSYTGNMIMFRCDRCGQVKFFDSAFLHYTTVEEDVPIPAEKPVEKPKPVRFRPGKKPPWEK